MKEQMMYWQGSELVLTPHRRYAKTVRKIIIVGILFLLLCLYLSVRFKDFWQLPLAIGLALTVFPILYSIGVVRMEVHIPKGPGMISYHISGLYRKNVLNKSEAMTVRNAVNGRTFIAFANKQNPYGNAYQISPFLSKKKVESFFTEEIMPLILQQLNG